MRLLKLSSGGQISLTGDFINDVPHYAILSHTWGSDDDEVTFNDLNNGTGDTKKGYVKIQFCADQARKNGLEYFWVDTCCIDKAYGPELQEAITSMFRWYRRAVQCYVYLSDVSIDTERRWKSAFRKSKWFTRGWTLQELIAPDVVEFFSREGELLGSKKSLEQSIHEITQIPIEALRGAPLSDFSVSERLRWAEGRVTKKQEDQAYCLMGLFNVFMPLIYGEEENALIRLKKKIDNLQKSELDEATLKPLNDLKITNPLEDMTRIELSKDPLLEDCYQWILRDPNFQAWHRIDAVPLLWINGDPGKGKTMLMIALARELSNDVCDNLSAVTYFFCQSTDIRLNNAVSILRGLIWKLATDQPRLVKHIHNRGAIDKRLLSGPNAVISLFSVLSSMLNDSPRTFLLIDALDECNPGVERDQLLSLILKHSKSSSKAKWLIASRNYPEIKQLLESESRMLSLELNEQHISNAVAIFIEQKTGELARTKKYSPDLKEKVKNVLTIKADSTFLWVALACKSLFDIKVTRRRTLSALENLPLGLEALYARMMEGVFQGEDEDEDRGFCMRILRSVSLALRPLSQEELMIIADLPRELLEDDGLSELTERCGSFIFVREHILYFIHQSAKDYLVGRGARKLFPAGFQHEHGLIVDRSLDAMLNALSRNMCNLKHPGSPASEAEVLPRLRAINYSCSFWVEHLTNYLTDPPDNLCSEEYLADGGRIYKFLLRHLLHWFEALSAVGQINRGILGLHTLEQVIGHATSHLQPGSTLRHGNIVHDALRVFRQFRPALEEAPLQVYHSALIFSPENSVIRIQFKDESPNWIYSHPQIRKEWTPCLQTLEGHTAEVRSVVYSPDGRQLASCSGDSTVRLWDAATGASQGTLEGHTAWVRSVVYSPDGRQLASCSYDTVWLWDAVTGASQGTLEGHTDGVSSVVYSPDGRQLASCSEDSTVRLWDAATGASQHTLEGHTDWVWSVVYSPDGRQLASCSSDKTVRLWDAATGASQGTLEGHTDWVWSVVYSPDGRQLASCSENSTVRLWDAATGASQHTLEGHTAEVRSVVYSPDGRQLASCSSDKTVRLWDAATGASQGTLEGHTDWVWSVVYSPDGRQLASCSSDKTVRLWDAVTGASQGMLEGHTAEVRSVVYSPDGRQLASCSSDKTVRLWDAATGPSQGTLEGHTDWVRSVVYSPDGRQLASCSEDSTVRLWDAATGASQHTLEGHTDGVRSVVYSPDGRQLASCSGDKTVRLWDAATGASQHTLEGHTDGVWSVVYSPDGRQLASCSGDKTVRLWDAATGAPQHTLEGHTDWVWSVVYSPDGRQLASCSEDSTVRLWDAATGASQHTLEGHTDWVWSVVYSPDGRQLASCSGDKTVRLWDAVTGASQHTLEGHTDGVSSVVYSPDGRQLASCSEDSTVRLWDAATGASQGALEGHTGKVAFSPDGLAIVTDSGFWSISLTSHFDYSLKRRGCGIDSEKKWATWNGTNVLWLPPEYRPVVSAVKEDGVAIGCISGVVYILNFCAKSLAFEIARKDRFTIPDSPYTDPPPSSTP